MDFSLYQTLSLYLSTTGSLHTHFFPVPCFFTYVHNYMYTLFLRLAFSHMYKIICLYTIFPYQFTYRDASLPLRIIKHFIEWIYSNLLACLILKEIQFASDILQLQTMLQCISISISINLSIYLSSYLYYNADTYLWINTWK